MSLDQWIQVVIALGTLGTFVVALVALLQWANNVYGAYDVDLVRRMVEQLQRVRTNLEHIIYASHLAPQAWARYEKEVKLGTRALLDLAKEAEIAGWEEIVAAAWNISITAMSVSTHMGTIAEAGNYSEAVQADLEQGRKDRLDEYDSANDRIDELLRAMLPARSGKRFRTLSKQYYRRLLDEIPVWRERLGINPPSLFSSQIIRSLSQRESDKDQDQATK